MIKMVTVPKDLDMRARLTLLEIENRLLKDMNRDHEKELSVLRKYKQNVLPSILSSCLNFLSIFMIFLSIVLPLLARFYASSLSAASFPNS